MRFGASNQLLLFDTILDGIQKRTKFACSGLHFTFDVGLHFTRQILHFTGIVERCSRLHFTGRLEGNGIAWLMCGALHIIVEDGVPKETIQVRLALASSLMGKKSPALQLGHVRFDLTNRFAHSLRHGLERVPKGSVLAGPADRALIKPLLAVSQITLACYDVRRVEATLLVPWVERLTDFVTLAGRKFAF